MALIQVEQTITTQQYADTVDKSLPYSHDAFLFYVDVTLISQDEVNATSRITIRHRLKCIRSYWKNYSNIYGEIAIGTDVKDTKHLATTELGKTYTLGTWTGDVAHDEDGELTITVNGNWYGDYGSSRYSPENNVLTNIIDFPAIQRVSKLSVTPATLTSGNLSISITKYVSTYTTTVKYKVEGTEYTLATNSADTSFSLSFNALKALIGSFTSSVVEITAITYDNDYEIGSDRKSIIVQTGKIPLSLYDNRKGSVGVTFGGEATGAGFNVKDMNLIMSNARNIVCVDSSEDANWIDVLQMSADNILMLGYGTMDFDYDTTVYGKNVNLQNKYGGRVTLEDGNSSYAGYLNANNNTMTLGTSAKLWYRLYCRNSVYVSSDERTKKYINDLDNKYEDLFHKLNPKRFKFKKDGIDDTNWHLGFIAQEVEQAINEVDLSKLALIEHSFFEEDGEQKDRYVLAYEEFIALNTHMLQKAYAKIEELENRITELEELVNG
jgi:hypothetical protein